MKKILLIWMISNDYKYSCLIWFNWYVPVYSDMGALFYLLWEDFIMTHENEQFEKWMAEVDAILIRKIGLSSIYLPDCDYYGMFACGDSPSEAAYYAIDYADDADTLDMPDFEDLLGY